MRDGPEDQQVVGIARSIEVGEDADGKVLSSLVIEPYDGEGQYWWRAPTSISTTGR